MISKSCDSVSVRYSAEMLHSHKHLNPFMADSREVSLAAVVEVALNYSATRHSVLKYAQTGWYCVFGSADEVNQLHELR